jgi:hypothetical protein
MNKSDLTKRELHEAFWKLPEAFEYLPNLKETFDEVGILPSYCVLTMCPVRNCQYIGQFTIFAQPTDGKTTDAPYAATSSRSALNGAYLYAQLLHFFPQVPAYRDDGKLCPNHRST